MPYLVVVLPGKSPVRFALHGQPVTIGREKGCQIRFNDKRLSRQHCRIEPTEDGRWRVVDLGSTNGTWVHGRRVEEHRLRDGEAFHASIARIVFHADDYHPRPSVPEEHQDHEPPEDPSHETLADSRFPRPQPRPNRPGEVRPEVVEPWPDPGDSGSPLRPSTDDEGRG